jgi:hypothetical protein
MPEAHPLAIPLGQPGSGRLRYSAAMAQYQLGRLSAEALEVFRICAPRDGEDPAGLLAARGLLEDLPAVAPEDPESSIRLLIDEADRYLSTLPGPGVAEVRAGIAAARGGAVAVRAGSNDVVDALLADGLVQVAQTHPALAAAIAGAASHLKWITYDGYPPDQIGEAFRTGHAYASIIGEEGAVPATDFDLGLFLIAPHVLYRDHCHKAPELYAPLTGPHGWRFGPDMPLVIKPAHDPVWNAPYAPHLTKVGPVPFLCLFGWTRDVAEVARVIPAPDWAELEALRLG